MRLFTSFINKNLLSSHIHRNLADFKFDMKTYWIFFILHREHFNVPFLLRETKGEGETDTEQVGCDLLDINLLPLHQTFSGDMEETLPSLLR